MNISTKQILEQEGWTENRKIDIKAITTELNDKGYSLFLEFIDFIEKFGEMDFKLYVDGNERYISFYIHDSISIEYDEVILDDYVRMIGCKNLIIIGNIGRKTVLVMNEKGNVYSLHDGFVMKIGNKINAIDNLFHKPWREFEEISTPDWWGQ